MTVVTISIACVRRDPHQVRKIFDKEKLDGLAKSVEQVGLLHPILVKQQGEYYQLVAGERRFEAAKQLGYTTLPAVILQEGIQVKQVQLVENLQREDLNPVERAIAVQEFMTMEKLSKAAAAQKLGVPRTTLTDWLDVLGVDQRYQRALVDNFYGGDCPLALSHISEAKALAARLHSPAMCNVLLDAVLEYRLSKVETREVCSIVRENANITIEDAVKVVRRPADVNKLPKEEIDERQAVEKNIEKWVASLERSTSTLTQLQRIAPKYFPEDERERILGRLQELHEMIEGTLLHMNNKGSIEEAS